MISQQNSQIYITNCLLLQIVCFLPQSLLSNFLVKNCSFLLASFSLVSGLNGPGSVQVPWSGFVYDDLCLQLLKVFLFWAPLGGFLVVWLWLVWHS